MIGTNLRELDREALIEYETSFSKSLGKDWYRLLWAVVPELATGQPADPRRIAARAGLPLDRTLVIGREGNWELDPSGERVVGSGLTMIETPHRVDIDGRTMWTWCVPDALMLPVMLGKQVRLQSPCAVTGDLIRVHLTPAGVESVDPPGAVVSFPPEMPFGDLARVRRDACSQGNLFRDAETASSWLAAFPTGTVLPVADADAVLRAINLRLKEWFEQPDR